MTDIPAIPGSIGTSSVIASERRAARSDVYRAQQQARAQYREIAWLLIKYRMDHDLTQQDLADRVGIRLSQIARIEGGRSKTSLDTLLRIAHALDLKMLIGFEGTSSEGHPQRQFVTL